MENKNYTIKDIARMSGVSAGTVDRVLHNRGDVSVSSREKVQKVLDEIDYHPNMFAIGLAAKKHYHIVCIIPYYIEHDYWYAVAAELTVPHKNYGRSMLELAICTIGMRTNPPIKKHVLCSGRKMPTPYLLPRISERRP